MRRLVARSSALMSLIACNSVQAGECAMPPVSTAHQAKCFAGKFVEGGLPLQWQVAYYAEDAGPFWYVRYEPRGEGVRGGAGMLKVDKTSGTVTVLQAYR